MTDSSRSAARRKKGGEHRAGPEFVEPGDWIEVDGTLGAGPRRGEVLAVLGTAGHIHFRVRWDEQHESLFYPEERGWIVHAHAER